MSGSFGVFVRVAVVAVGIAGLVAMAVLNSEPETVVRCDRCRTVLVRTSDAVPSDREWRLCKSCARKVERAIQ